MDYVNLGRTGVKVSPLCLGCMNFGLRATEEESIPVIQHAIDNGVNFIDTANIYGLMPTDPPMGEGPGRSEEIVGKALKQSSRRDWVVLATKVHATMRPDDPNGSGITRRHIIAEVEQSLRRLGTDYIDLYQLHAPMTEAAHDESFRALDDLVRSGKIRYFGTSSFPAWRIMEGLHISAQLGLNRLVSEQPQYNLLNRRIEREVVPMAQAHDVAILPWSPLAMGFLTGKYSRDDAPPEGSRFSSPLNWLHYMGDRAHNLLDVMREMAAEKGCTVSQLAIAWVMNQPAVTSVIIGPRTVDQLDDNLGALYVKITDEERERLNKVTKPRDHILEI